MSFRKLLMALAVTLTLNSVVALGQDSKDGLDFSCRKWEDRQWSACGASAFDLSRKFQIGHSPSTEMGIITIVNRTNRHVRLELVEFSPAYNHDDKEQPYWFGGVVKSQMSAKRGEKMTLRPVFAGRMKYTVSHAVRPWVAEGTHEGSMKIRNKDTGSIYEFKFTVHAFKPGKK